MHQNSLYFTEAPEQPVPYTNNTTAGNIHKRRNSRYFTQAPQQPVYYTSIRTARILHKHQNSRYFTQAPEQPVLYTSTRTAGTLHKHYHTVLITSRSVLLRIKILHTKVVQKIKAHFVFSNCFFFRKSCRLWHNVEKCCRAGQSKMAI